MRKDDRDRIHLMTQLTVPAAKGGGGMELRLQLLPRWRFGHHSLSGKILQSARCR